ncbi:MAG: hypothetical protein M1834_004571 [Cirrosporium novae-zelandiae]|nr:MAG: hypothetical protein M1834_004571 [Cirrosporium novae-zelandiae]
MAILKHIKAEILVNGKPIKEYSDATVDNNAGSSSDRVTRYIEAQSGATFEIKVLCFDVFYRIDAHDLGEVVINKEYRDRQKRGLVGMISGYFNREDDKWTVERFKFIETTISDEVPPKEQLERLKSRALKIGSIKVQVWRGRYKRGHGDHEESGIETDSSCDMDFEEYGDLIEQDMKALPESTVKGQEVTHQTRIGPPEPIGKFKPRPILRVGKRPLATFVFKYRSLENTEALKKLGIIPRTPAPLPLEERPIEELSRNELHELVSRQKTQLQEQETRVKRERAEDNTIAIERPRKTIKQEGVKGSASHFSDEVELLSSQPMGKSNPCTGAAIYLD